MKFKDINNNIIKKSLGLQKGRIRYHNKNTRGGNFGIDFSSYEFEDPLYESYEINGDYDIEGNLYDVHIGTSFWARTKINPIDLDDLIKLMKSMINQNREEKGIEVIQ